MSEERLKDVLKRSDVQTQENLALQAKAKEMTERVEHTTYELQMQMKRAEGLEVGVHFSTPKSS